MKTVAKRMVSLTLVLLVVLSLSATAFAVDTIAAYGTVTAGATLYSQASSSSSAIGTFSTGGRVGIISQSGSFYRISTGSYVGYVLTNAVTLTAGGSAPIQTTPTSPMPTQPPAANPADPSYTAYSTAQSGVAKEAIWMRSSASSSSSANVIAKITDAKGKTFTLLGYSGNFYYAQYQSYKGFVRMQDFTLSTAGSTPSTPSTGASKNISVTKTTTVYSGPTTAADSLGRANVGEVFATTGFSSATKQWYKITYKNQVGYVRASDVSEVTTPANTSYYATYTGTSSDIWGHMKISGTNINQAIYNNSIKNGTFAYSAYSSKVNYIFAMTPLNAKYAVVMGHNMRVSGTGTHGLHHVQNAWLGKSKCEKCSSSLSSSRTSTFDITYDGYSKWNLVCFYEVGKNEPDSTLTNYVTSAMNGNSSWFSTLKSQCTSANKGAVLDNSATANDKLMLLITCGDEYDSKNRAKLYMVLKAVG